MSWSAANNTVCTSAQRQAASHPGRQMDKRYLVSALLYALLGMALGLVMAASHDHRQFVTHAHVLLIGFVASLLYAIIHKLWLPGIAGRLVTAQFLAHQVGAAAMAVGLGLLYGNTVPVPFLEPLLAAGAVAVLGGALAMLVLVLAAGDQRCPELDRSRAGEYQRRTLAP